MDSVVVKGVRVGPLASNEGGGRLLVRMYSSKVAASWRMVWASSVNDIAYIDCPAGNSQILATQLCT